MDYGSGFYMGVQQFHPKKREELCTFLSRAKANSCPQLAVVATAGNSTSGRNGTTPIMCGDGVLGPEEQCECLDQSLSCGACIQCRLTSPLVECSTSFAIRRPQDRGFVKVGKEMVSSPECCSASGEVAVARTCNGGRDMCSLGGFCTSVCRSLGLVGCGSDSAGCRQKCMVNGLCVDVSPRMTVRNVSLNAVPDGTVCRSLDPLRPVSTKGQCGNGVCLFNGVPEATRSPTPRPTVAQSKPPIPPVLETASPTPMPTTRPTVNCQAFRRKNLCPKRACRWCSNKLGCRSSCAAPRRASQAKRSGRRM